MAEQEIDDGCFVHVSRGQGLVVGHQESDAASEHIGRGQVDERDEGEVVGSLHLLSGVCHFCGEIRGR